ncbi:MAG: hypothetical protein V3S51_08965 [Dehalococcoidia bacterium]
MTLIIGTRCRDGVALTADRRRLMRHEKGPAANKLLTLACGVALAGAGDDAVLNEARILIDRRVMELGSQSPPETLFDIVQITSSVVNELVGYYRDTIEEPFGFALAGLENLHSGAAELWTVFGAGLLEVPWACFGAGGSYARPLVELLLAEGDLSTEEAAKVIPVLFTLVSNVQTAVGGGVDTCIVRDGHGPGDVTHRQDVSLDGLRTAILDTLNVESG